MKFSEVVVHMGTTTSPSFIKIGWKNDKYRQFNRNVVCYVSIKVLLSGRRIRPLSINEGENMYKNLDFENETIHIFLHSPPVYHILKNAKK